MQVITMDRCQILYVSAIFWVCLDACLALQHDFGQDVFQIAVDNKTGDVYIGGDNVVYHLTHNLTVIGNTTLTDCFSCKNRVKVLEIDDKFRRLLVCGSESQGQCKFYDLDNVELTEDLNVSIDSGVEPLQGSKIEVNESHTPIVQFVSDSLPLALNTSRMVVASSNYQRQQPPGDSSKPILSVREIWNISGEFDMRYVSTKISSPFDYMLVRKHDPNFVFDFLGGFCHNGECFFLTLQNVNASSPELITRVGSVCENSFFPYVEIPLNECVEQPDRAKYDRALAMTLARVKTDIQGDDLVVIFILGKAANAASRDVNTQEGFAICTLKLAELSKGINITKRLCSDRTNYSRIPHWFGVSALDCVQETPGTDRCSDSVNRVVQAQRAEYKHPKKVGEFPGDGETVTSVFTYTHQGLSDRVTIYVAMSDGRIKRFYSEWSRTELKPIGEEPTESQKRTPRSDFAVTSHYYFMLIGTKVVRRPLDYCQYARTCQECSQTSGCAWCLDDDACHLEAKCPEAKCPLEIKSIWPMSGPREGGTMLKVSSTYPEPRLIGSATVLICGQECMINWSLASHSNQSVYCIVPPSLDLTENTTEHACNVTVSIKLSSARALAPEKFRYLIPSVRSFKPTKMYFQESGEITFFGQHLDVGFKAEVTVGENSTCLYKSRGQTHITCYLPRPNDTGTLEECSCYAIIVAIDNARLHPSDNMTFCRCEGLLVAGIQPSWTFASGVLPVTVRGTNLDMVKTIQMGIRVHHLDTTNDTHNDRPCEPCLDDTCVVCHSPNVTSTVTSSGQNVSADVYFNMMSRDHQKLEYNKDKNLTMVLLPDPKFWFEGHTETGCWHVRPDDSKFQIMGENIPHKAWIQVRFDHINCTILSSSPTSLTCDLKEIKSALASVANESQEHRKEQNDLAEKHRITVFIRGIQFLDACVDLSGRTFAEKQKKILLFAVGGVSGGVVLLVVLTAVCCLYIKRAKRRHFEERRYMVEQNSGASGSALIPSPIGSAENTYVSLAHLLNPQHDRRKKREIHEKGLLIQRKYLTLGNVIGHGNFGCVYEGFLQRPSGGENEDDIPQKVAVKTLLDPATHAIDLQSFINEALLMKDFDHEHVLGLLGLSEGDRGLPLVVLPYMARGDLLTYVKDESVEMTVGDVLKFCMDIASGMDYLASQKLVHRDLAARNCMLDDDLRVKVADFGLCRDVYEKGYYHSDNKKKLPIRWMAIESIEKGTYSIKSDMWSMGVVIWELTTRGIIPYPGVEGWDILRYLQAGRRLDQPLLCPDPLYALMGRCWDEKPLRRPLFHEMKQNFQNYTEYLVVPAATNAICVDTKISIPRCHRFKDDAAVVEKVLMGMRKLEMAQLRTSTRVKDPRTSPRRLGRVSGTSVPIIGISFIFVR